MLISIQAGPLAPLPDLALTKEDNLKNKIISVLPYLALVLFLSAPAVGFYVWSVAPR